MPSLDVRKKIAYDGIIKILEEQHLSLIPVLELFDVPEEPKQSPIQLS